MCMPRMPFGIAISTTTTMLFIFIEHHVYGMCDVCRANAILIFIPVKQHRQWRIAYVFSILDIIVIRPNEMFSIFRIYLCNRFIFSLLALRCVRSMGTELGNAYQAVADDAFRFVYTYTPPLFIIACKMVKLATLSEFLNFNGHAHPVAIALNK